MSWQSPKTSARTGNYSESATRCAHLSFRQHRARAARELGLELLVLKFAVAEEIERAFEVANSKRAEALLPTSDPMALDNAKRIAELSLQYRIPVISPFQKITEAGGCGRLRAGPFDAISA
jgi:ABC-type uncharacterized transport system substrate-binding protein